MRVDLRGNIKTVGPVFFTASRDKAYDRRLVQRLVTIETEEPWHRGTGWGILLLPNVLVGVGTWQPDETEHVVEAREANEIAQEIPDWRIAFRIDMDEEPPADNGWTIVPMEDSAA